MTSAAEILRHEAPESDEIVRVLRPDASLDPELDPGLSSAEVVELYRHMMRTRLLDERLVSLQRQGRIGFHIGSLGEEAAILGSAYAMRKNDWIFPCYREFGAALLRGFSLQRYLDNMFGNVDDPVKGRQMPDHFTARGVNFGSVSSPIGTQITQAVGFGWAAKIQKRDVAVLVYFGEGATSSNEFHNGMNFAGVFKTPTIMLCRNNGWAISVPTERQTASRTFADKGIAYGIPAVRVDGNDIFAVIAVTREAVRRASQGEGPTLIEAITYRMAGHSTSDDPTRYRPTDELEPWRLRDPMLRLRRHLDREELWSDAAEEQLKAEIEQRIREAVENAEKAPPPALTTLFEDVYAKLPWHLREQQEELLAGPRPDPKHH